MALWKGGVNSMKIFVSYASEYRRDADAIALALRQEGHEVFFDRDALPAGEAYHARIRAAIESADLFIFLVAPESVAKKSYAVTELSLARSWWPDPSGRVLPVLVKATPFEDIPEYLKAVTVVEPTGSLVAEVVARVDRLARVGGRRRLIRATGAALGLAVAGGAAWWLAGSTPPAAPCYLSISVTARPGAGAQPAGMSLDIAHAGSTQAFLVPDSGVAPVQVGPLTTPTTPWTITLRSGDGSPLGTQEMRGCPGSDAAFALGDSLELVVKPRQP